MIFVDNVKYMWYPWHFWWDMWQFYSLAVTHSEISPRPCDTNKYHYTAHFTLHTAHSFDCYLNIAYYAIQTALRHTAYYQVHTTHYTLNTVHCTPQTAHWTLNHSHFLFCFIGAWYKHYFILGQINLGSLLNTFVKCKSSTVLQ